jgi:transcriptional regulator with XRE-family HTH domain
VTPEDLRYWRLSHHLTQQQLADWLGVISLTVIRWEGGSRAMPPFLFLALARVEQLLPVPT